MVVVMRVVILNRWNSCLDSRHHRRNASMSLTKTYLLRHSDQLTQSGAHFEREHLAIEYLE